MVANNAYTEIGFNVQAVGPLIQQIELYNSQPIFGETPPMQQAVNLKVV